MQSNVTGHRTPETARAGKPSGSGGLHPLPAKAKALGFAAIIGESSSGHAGGAAVFVDERAHGISTDGMTHETHLNGRVVTVTVTAHGQPLKVASVYAPSGPYAREEFAQHMRRERPLRGCEVVQVDWNCVPSVLTDVRYPRGSTTTSTTKYVNAH